MPCFSEQYPRSHSPVVPWVESLVAIDGQVFVVVRLSVPAAVPGEGFVVKLNGQVFLVAVCLSVVVRGLAGGFLDKLENRLFVTRPLLVLGARSGVLFRCYSTQRTRVQFQFNSIKFNSILFI